MKETKYVQREAQKREAASAEMHHAILNVHCRKRNYRSEGESKKTKVQIKERQLIRIHLQNYKTQAITSLHIV